MAHFQVLYNMCKLRTGDFRTFPPVLDEHEL